MNPHTIRIVIPSVLFGIAIGLLIARYHFNAKYVVTPFGDVIPRSQVHTIPVKP